MRPELSLVTRTLLLKRLKDLEDHQGWEQFATIYREFIRRLALRAKLSEDDAEEVVQEVLISVARNIHGFKYDRSVSSFRHWLTRVVRWRIADHHRRRIRQAQLFSAVESDTSRTDQLEKIPDSSIPETDSSADRAWGERLVAAALERVKSLVSPKQYQIYFLHVLREQRVPEVCRRLQVNRGQVYLAKCRVARLVEAEIRKLTANASTS